MNPGRLFLAELRREAILLVRYPLETVSRLVWNLGFALLIFFGFSAAVGSQASGLPGFEEGNVGRLLGLLTTYIAINGLGNAAELIAEEVQTGTLEQAALSPPPLVLVVLLRDLASYVEMLLRFALVLAIACLVTGVRLHLDLPAYVVLLTLMYLGMEGIGLMLGGAGLIAKRITTLAQFAVMLVFGLAIVPLDGLPAWARPFVTAFPFTNALEQLRAVAVGGTSLGVLWQDGRLPILLWGALAWLALGLMVFAWAERKARDLGTLNQY